MDMNIINLKEGEASAPIAPSPVSDPGQSLCAKFKHNKCHSSHSSLDEYYYATISSMLHTAHISTAGVNVKSQPPPFKILAPTLVPPSHHISAPLDVIAMASSSTAIDVIWTEPSMPSGVIRCYHIIIPHTPKTLTVSTSVGLKSTSHQN